MLKTWRRLPAGLRGYRKVTHITVPTDIQDMNSPAGPHPSETFRGIPHWSHAASGHLPGEADLKRAAEILNTGKKIAILAGQGALRATDALLASRKN